MQRIVFWLAGSWLQALSCLAASLPFVITAVRSARLQRQAVTLSRLGLLAIFFIVDITLARSESAGVLMRAPWQGMLLEAAFALAVILATRSARKAGLTLRITGRDWQASLVVTALLLLFVATRSALLDALGIASGGSNAVPAEYFVYLLTMPGIAEELSYRGVIQPGLNAVFGRPWKILGAQVGWGWIIAGVIFWATHAFRVDPPL